MATEKQSKMNIDKVKKGIRNTALGLGAAAALGVTPGVVGAVKNAKTQNLNRQKAAQEYQMSQQELNARRNEMAKKIRDTGIEVDEDTKEIAQKAKKKAKKLKDKAVEKINDLREETIVDYFPY